MFSQSHKIAIYMKINLISKPCWLTERSFCQIPIAITAPILGTPVLWVKTILPNWDGGYWNKSYHRRKNCEGGLKGSAVYESCLSFRENKNGRRLQKVAENVVELKTIVFALFSQKEKSAT